MSGDEITVDGWLAAMVNWPWYFGDTGRQSGRLILLEFMFYYIDNVDISHRRKKK